MERDILPLTQTQSNNQAQNIIFSVTQIIVLYQTQINPQHFGTARLSKYFNRKSIHVQYRLKLIHFKFKVYSA